MSKNDLPLPGMEGDRQKPGHEQTPRENQPLNVNAAPPPSPADVWITEDEMRRRLQMHANTLRRHRERGHLGFSKVGGKIFYTEKDLQDFLRRFYKGPLLLLVWISSWLGDCVEFADLF